MDYSSLLLIAPDHARYARAHSLSLTVRRHTMSLNMTAEWPDAPLMTGTESPLTAHCHSFDCCSHFGRSLIPPPVFNCTRRQCSNQRSACRLPQRLLNGSHFSGDYWLRCWSQFHCLFAPYFARQMICTYCVQDRWLNGATRKYCSGETDIVSSKNSARTISSRTCLRATYSVGAAFLHFVCCWRFYRK